MRITHFLHRLPPEYSGAAIQAITLIGQLSNIENLNCSIVSLTEVATQPNSSIPCEQVIIKIGRGVTGKLLQLSQLLRAVVRSRCDVLHVHGFYLAVVVLGILMSKKIVLKTTLLGVDDLRSLAKRYPVLFRLLILPRIDAVISLNNALASANAKAGDRNYLIPNGVRWSEAPKNRREIERCGILGTLGVAPAKFVFLYVGGDSVRKGFEELPGVWRRTVSALGHTRVHLIVVGRFSRPDSEQRLLDLCGIDGSVTVLPQFVDLSELLRACDVFVSLSFAEGLPNAVLEAAASDTLVLTRALPGVFDGILDEHNSIQFETFDSTTVSKLKNYVDGYVIDNSNLAAKLDISVIAKNYVNLYKHLV
jgi:glycosyltransferase involved in cell wall biosynthesis